MDAMESCHLLEKEPQVCFTVVIWYMSSSHFPIESGILFYWHSTWCGGHGVKTSFMAWSRGQRVFFLDVVKGSKGLFLGVVKGQI